MHLEPIHERSFMGSLMGASTVCTVSNSSPIAVRTIMGRIFMLRRLEDRIRELCAQTIVARGANELEPIFSELKSALHEHTERLRKNAVLKLVRRNGDSSNRRCA